MSLSESHGCSHDLINQIMHSYRDQFFQEWNSCLLSEPCCLPHPSPVLLHIYCPHPLCCCIYTALIPCVAAYILPSSPVLLHIYCPHPLYMCCCIYTALIPCVAAYILSSSPVLLHIYCPHPLCCCIYTLLIPCVAAYILSSSPVLLHIYCPHPLCCCIYTALVSPFFGTLIPTSFNILMKMFLPLHQTLKCFEIHTSMCIHDSFNFFSIATSTFMLCVYAISITEICFSNRYVHLNGSLPFRHEESISDALKFTLLCAYMAL